MGDKPPRTGPNADTTGLDALFRLPLATFTTSRNARASRLRRAGRTDEAALIQACPKPSAPAWAVNQLYWRQRKAFDRLLTAGQRLRDAQAKAMLGEASDIREPIEELRGALSTLTRQAADLLRDAGREPVPDLMRRVTTTLEALAAYGTDAGATAGLPSPGRLTHDVDPPGFAALAALVPRVGGVKEAEEESRLLAFRQGRTAASSRGTKGHTTTEAEAAAAAATALRVAEGGFRKARREAARAERLLKASALRARDAARADARAAAHHEKTAAAAAAARQAALRAAADAEAAAQAVSDQERAVEAARAALQRHRPERRR